MSSKPTLVWIPGAWHSPDCYDPTLNELGDFEHAKSAHKSCSASPPLASKQPDIDAHGAVTRGVLDKGNDAVLICHSYGGLPAAHVVDELSRAALGPGKPAVRGLIFVCAFALPPGRAITPIAPELKWPPWVKHLDDDEREGIPEGAHDVFYHDIDKATADKLEAAIEVQSLRALSDPVTVTGHLKLPTAYLLCTEDHAIPIDLQRQMADWLASEGQLVHRHEIDASHSPFVSQPKATADFIRKAVDACLSASA